MPKNLLTEIGSLLLIQKATDLQRLSFSFIPKGLGRISLINLDSWTYDSFISSYSFNKFNLFNH